MSLQSANQFLNKVRTDESFAIQLLESDSKESRRKIANSAGFSFSESELELAKSNFSELYLSVYETELTMNTARACCPCMGCREDAAFA